jgi:hypothetical protein
MQRATLSRAGGTASRSVESAQQGARTLARRERHWLEPLGRAGYAANGLVYVIVGVLAVQAAAGTGGDTTDTGGAIGHIIEAPFGQFLVGAVAVGLMGYALCRMLQALLDTERKGVVPGDWCNASGSRLPR